MKLIDLTGQRYGRLLVIGRHGHCGELVSWNVLCDCGTKKVVSGKHLRRGSTVTCGCGKIERITKHGMARTRQYQTWSAMVERCTKPYCEAYPAYGGRGIKVCDEWMEFEAFWEDMKVGYADNLTIERIDVDGDYCKANCRWASKKEQARNTRRTVLVEYKGRMMSAAEAAELSGVPAFSIRQRLRAGYSGSAVFAKRIESGRLRRGHTERGMVL